MLSYLKLKLSYIAIFTLLIFISIRGQTKILDDPLNGKTSSGTLVGGSFSSEGYKPGKGAGHILYKLPQQVPNGYLEFEMKGFTPSAIQDAEKDADNGFVGQYDGRGFSEPVKYFNDFKANFFRWNFHYRQNRGAFKAVIQCAAPTSSRLNASKAYFGFTSTGLIAKDWGEEPTGKSFSFNSTSWYKVKIQWKDKHFVITINGSVVWEAHGPYDYAPKDHRIWLGSAPGVGDKYTNSAPNTVFRNFKVYTYGSSTTPVNNLSVSPSSQNVGSSAGSSNFSVSSNVSWSVSDNASWLTVSPTSGSNNNTLKATYTQNTSSSSRTGTITTSGGGITRTVTVVQSGTSTSSNSLTVSPSNQNVGSSAGSSNFSVSSNVSWSVSDNASWVTLSPSSGSNNGSVKASYSANSSTSSRTAALTFVGGGITRTATITQSGSSSSGGGNYLNVPASLNISKGSGSITVEVSSNVSWTVRDNTGATGGWISKTPKTGNGDGKVTMSYKANTSSSSRTGALVFTGGGMTKTVSVTQAGTSTSANSLTLSPSSQNVSFSAGSANFTVSSNVSWSVTDNAGWVVLSPASGSNNGTIAASFTENTSTSSRSATVTVTGGGITRTAMLTQAGKSSTGGSNYINVPATLALPKDAGTVMVDVNSDITWYVRDNTGSPGWISKTPKTGTGNGKVTVTYRANSSADSRTGSLIFTGGGMSKIVVITQSGSSSSGGGGGEGGENFIDVPSSINLAGNAGSYTIDVKSNVTWYVRDNTGTGSSGWMSKSPKTGTGNAKVTVRYQTNATGSSRSGQLIFTSNGIKKIIAISQSASPNALTKKNDESNELMKTEEIQEVPSDYSLMQNYPNPFNPTTQIKFGLKKSQNVKITVYNLMGEEVRQLVNNQLNAGIHYISFDASGLASGVYIYRLISEDFTSTKRMILLK